MITSRSTLITALEDQSERADITSTQWGEFIQRAEARMNRFLRVNSAVGRSTATISSGFSAVPTDFGAARSIRLSDSPYTVLGFLTPVQMGEFKATLPSGTVKYYALVDGEFEFGPEPVEDTDVVLDYIKKVPALTADADTNWVLDDHPDAYFRGAITEFFDWAHDERAVSNKALFDEIMNEILQASRRDSMAYTLTPTPSAVAI